MKRATDPGMDQLPEGVHLYAPMTDQLTSSNDITSHISR